MGSLKCVDARDDCDNTWLNKTNNAPEGKTMNRTVEKITAGHYLVITDECGQFSVSRHDGKWNLRRAGHLIDSFPTKKEAMREIGEQQRIVRNNNWKAAQAT